MTVYHKPTLDIQEVEKLLNDYFDSKVIEVTPLQGGNLSAVFSFSVSDQAYVIKFNELAGSFDTEVFLSKLLTAHGIPFPSCIDLSNHKSYQFLITEKISGVTLANCSPEQQRRLIPEVIQLLTRMNQIDINHTQGYGFIDASGNGTHPSWKEHILAIHAEDQTGTFWEGWHSLFQTSCLEKDVYDECYNRLLAYSTYNEPHRYFVHGDFHQFNLMSDGQRMTGIIDTNSKYGDFLIDLATLDWHMRPFDVIQEYQNYQRITGASIPNFKERLIGAKYYNGLIGLRFYAKMGIDQAYYGLREELLNLIN